MIPAYVSLKSSVYGRQAPDPQLKCDNSEQICYFPGMESSLDLELQHAANNDDAGGLFVIYMKGIVSKILDCRTQL